VSERVKEENGTRNSREWKPRASWKTNSIGKRLAVGFMAGNVKSEVEWWWRGSGAWGRRGGGLDSAALARTARGVGIKLTNCREISFGFGSAEFTSSRIVCTGGLFSSIKSAEPNPRFLTWVSDLSCITSPWSLPDASKTDLRSRAIRAVVVVRSFSRSHFSVGGFLFLFFGGFVCWLGARFDRKEAGSWFIYIGREPERRREKGLLLPGVICWRFVGPVNDRICGFSYTNQFS
jgi:hypothetical protein